MGKDEWEEREGTGEKRAEEAGRGSGVGRGGRGERGRWGDRDEGMGIRMKARTLGARVSTSIRH